MHVTGWDALRDHVVRGRGMDVLAGCIDTARQQATGACILVDNGDALQGAPMGEICANWPYDKPHPWAAIVNALNYDAVGLGNHEFDFGVPFLERVVAQIDAPTLCASFSSGGVAGVIPTTLVQRDVTCSDGRTRPLSIGITSVLPPQNAVWNHRHVQRRITFESGVAATRKAVAALQQDGADVIVVLCHSGLPADAVADSENFAATLAQDVAGIDALVMGHTHRRFPEPDGPQDLFGVAAVMPGLGAEALGVIDLQLEWAGSHWRCRDHAVGITDLSPMDAPHPDITALAAPAIASTRETLDVELTQIKTGFHSYFDMLQTSPSGTLVAQAMMGMVADQVAGSELAALPLLASVAPAALGGWTGAENYVEVAPGVMRARHVAMLAPFSNAIWAVVLRGRDLWMWAERSTAYFAPDLQEDGRLVNPNAPSFNFDALYGLEAVIDPFAPPMFNPRGEVIDPDTRRVQSLTHHGVPVQADASFLVALSSYRGAGGGMFPGLDDNPNVLRGDKDLLTTLREAVINGQRPQDPVPPVWQLAPQAGRRVIVETSPHARVHLHDIARFDPEVIGMNDRGFLELSVAL